MNICISPIGHILDADNYAGHSFSFRMLIQQFSKCGTTNREHECAIRKYLTISKQLPSMCPP